MSREWKLDIKFGVDGQPYGTPSNEWKFHMMVPNLTPVQGPLRKIIWRYMKWEHLERSLRDREWFFPRVDRLGDPLEGSFSDTYEYTQDNPIFSDIPPDGIDKLNASARQLRKQTMQKLFYATCWHIDDHESELLWTRYGERHPDVVAVRTTMANLCALQPSILTLGGLEFIPQITAGEVKYIDHSVSGSVPDAELSLFYKSNVFKQDCEFRSIIQLWNLGFSQHDRTDLPDGIKVQIAPVRFFQEIIIKPAAASLMTNVNSVLEELGYEIPVSASTLDKQPIW